MKVILRVDVEGVGEAGQAVEVKSGYGRNYLLPRNLAIPATKANLRAIGEIENQKQARARKTRRQAEIVKDRIEKLELTQEVLVGEEEKLYGSVTSADVAELLAAQGVAVDKRVVQLETPIKALGVYTIPIKVDRDVTADLKLWVVKKS
jgi:large subunit ribosomal protein L9